MNPKDPKNLQKTSNKKIEKANSLKQTIKQNTNPPIQNASKSGKSVSKVNQSQDFLTSNVSVRTNKTLTSKTQINKKEDRIRESIKHLITTTMAESKRKSIKNTSTSIISGLTSPREENKFKFVEAKKTIIPYEEQIKTYIKNNFDNNFLCGLCFNLFNEPILCYKCEMIFCRLCLKNQIETKGKCNNCFNIIFYDQCKFSENDDYENLYEKTILNCIYYPVCKKSCPLNKIQEHINTCEFKELREKYDQIVMSKIGSYPENTKYSSIFENDVLENNAIFDFSKLNYPDRSKDPFLKLNLFDYLLKTQKPLKSFSFEEVSKSVGKADLKKKEYPIKYPEVKFNHDALGTFRSKLGLMNASITALNNKIGDVIIDLANITKVSNDKMKVMINN